MQKKARVLFLSHGGGPMPLLGDAGHREMVACLKQIAAQIKKPAAIILISAHWEEAVPTITAGANPALIYDYYGFPEASYHIQYPCPGEPALAVKIQALLENATISARLDTERGFDHGMFVPLKIMYPQADIPCVQISLVAALDPAAHLRLGEALRNLRDENLLIIGSGSSFHNLRAFFSQETSETQALHEAFESWLRETCASPNLSEAERAKRLTEWSKAPGARFCHPREEHLLPLHVCYGVAQTHSSESFDLQILGRRNSMYLW